MDKLQFINEVLLDCHVPLELWGRDANEKITKLYEGYRAGEMTFVQLEDGRLTVEIAHAVVAIRYSHWTLTEMIKQTKDGTVSVMSSMWSLRSVIPNDEDPSHAIIRAIYDAVFFGLEGNFEFELRKLDPLIKEPEIHPQYPGLLITDTVYPFVWDIPHSYYRSGGYFRQDRGDGIEKSYKWIYLHDETLPSPLLIREKS